MVLSSLCIMTSSGLLSSRTSCMLLTLLLWLPVLTDMLGMEWLLPRLSIFLLRFDPCSLSYKTRGISYRSCRSPAQHVPATPRVCFKGDSADFKGLWALFCQLHISKVLECSIWGRQLLPFPLQSDYIRIQKSVFYISLSLGMALGLIGDIQDYWMAGGRSLIFKRNDPSLNLNNASSQDLL